jgi:hypothetical protein
VLRLTDANPLSSDALTSANKVDVYFGVTSLAAGNQFRGGIYEDVETNFLNTVKNATYSYYVLGDGNGTHAFGQVNYYTLAEYNSAISVAISTVADTADFLHGTVTGGVMQFTTISIPEPGMFMLLASGLIGLLAYAWRKRK